MQVGLIDVYFDWFATPARAILAFLIDTAFGTAVYVGQSLAGTFYDP